MSLSLKRLLEANAGTLSLFLILLASLSLNLILGWRLRGVRPLKRSGVQVNSTLPVMPVLSQKGTRLTLSFDDPRPTVLYVLSPSCGWCKRNQANIRALASAKGHQFRFIGLSTHGEKLGEYLSASPLPFQVLVLDSPDLIKKIGLDATPQTVVVRPRGIVERVWVGAFDAIRQPEIEQFFNVKLPGLQEPVIPQ